MADLWDFDKELMAELGHFLKKANEQALYNRGLQPAYEGTDRNGVEIAALARDIEYYHPTITLDERMNNIARFVVAADVPEADVICNTIVSHFHGPTDIHQTLTGIEDRERALIDFTAIARGDKRYTKEMQDRAMAAKEAGKPLWNSLELRTSLWDSAKKFCQAKYDNPSRPLMPFDISEWIASFVTDGTCDGVVRSKSLEEVYGVISSHRGIGNFYGYHCGTSNSVNPRLAFHHDERFIVPGPGARKTIKALWGGKLPDSKAMEGVAFLRENQEGLGITEGVFFHPDTWNIVDRKGNTVFDEPQDELKYYGTEVLLCQFHCYMNLKENPHMAPKRRIKGYVPPGGTSGQSEMFE